VKRTRLRVGRATRQEIKSKLEGEAPTEIKFSLYSIRGSGCVDFGKETLTRFFIILLTKLQIYNGYCTKIMESPDEKFI
jgi:hypothetical protein